MELVRPLANSFSGKISPEEDVNAINIATEQPDGMTNLRSDILERQEVVGHLRRSRHLTRSLQAQHKKIQHKAVVLRDERRELKTPNDAVAVRVIHVFVSNHDVVLRGHVIGDIVIDNQPQQSIEKRQINLLVQLLELRLQQNVAFAFRHLPNILKIVDTWK